MPLPNAARMEEYARKGVELVLRQLAVAPEQRAARRLRSGMGLTDGRPRVLIVSPRDWAAHVQWEGMLAQALRLRGADVSFMTCGGDLEICDRVNTWEGPPPPCRTCRAYVHDSIDAHGFPRVALRDGWLDDDLGRWPELDEVTASALGEVVDLGPPGTAAVQALRSARFAVWRYAGWRSGVGCDTSRLSIQRL